MMVAYNILQNDLEGVENAYSDFNKTFNDICDAFKEVTGKNIKNGVNVRALQSSCEALKQKIANKEKPERYLEP